MLYNCIKFDTSNPKLSPHYSVQQLSIDAAVSISWLCLGGKLCVLLPFPEKHRRKCCETVLAVFGRCNLPTMEDDAFDIYDDLEEFDYKVKYDEVRAAQETFVFSSF